jgi:glycosyltransferase involved in cell wall biosynthesis
MKIGVMLRNYNQHGGGIRVHSHRLLQEMLTQNTEHDFVLLYRSPGQIGTYANMSRVKEICITAPNIFLWDQVAVRSAEKKENLDLIFNPKSSIPLTTKCKTVYVCHGLQWAVLPMRKPWSDHISHRFLIPRYAKKADAIIAVSKSTRRHLIEYLGVDKNRVHTVHLGVDERFRKPIQKESLERTRQLYNLPKRFLLYAGQIYPPKNFGRLLQAYARVGPDKGIFLVVVGEHRYFCEKELSLIDKLDISKWVVQPGWVDHKSLPSFYALAEALILPSLYESFGLPLLEAMASGCPVVTSNRYGMREVADQAGFFVDPENIDSIADGIRQVVDDDHLRRRMIDTGRQRAQNFTWQKCAQQTLSVMESVLEWK